MDEFTSISIWFLIILLSISAAVVWFDSSSVIQNSGLSIGYSGQTTYNEADMNSFRYNIFGSDCSTVSATDLVNTTACGFNQVWGGGQYLISTLWNFLTGWTKLLDAILTPLGSLGIFFKNILIPLFGLIEFVAIFIIGLRIFGVIRGGS